MARNRGNAHWQTVAGSLIVAALALEFAGCKSLAPEHVQTVAVERRDATRGQLLAILDDQSKLMRLKAAARVSILQESEVVPATIIDASRKERGKPYQKEFVQLEVNGSFFLTRDAEGRRNVRMSGDVEGARGMGFTLLGKDNAFWMLIPTTPEERDRAISAGEAAPRGKVLYGTVNPNGIRPAGRYTLRPQDFANLMLLTEARLTQEAQDICAIEKWPDYYVLSFLRPDEDWPNHLYAKVWVERQHLTVAIHQVFDVSGELVAEARFRAYAHYPISEKSKVRIDLPTEVEFLWPRDKIVLRAKFEDVKINGVADFVDAKVFDIKKFEGYPTESLDVAPSR